jgi:hypothetical protein
MYVIKRSDGRYAGPEGDGNRILADSVIWGKLAKAKRFQNYDDAQITAVMLGFGSLHAQFTHTITDGAGHLADPHEAMFGKLEGE